MSERLSFAGSRHAAGATFVSRCAGAKSPKSRPQPGKGSPDRGEHNQAFCNQHLQSAAHLPYHFSHKR